MNDEVIRKLKRMAEMASTSPGGPGIGFQDAEAREMLFVTYQEIGQLISDFEAEFARLRRAPVIRMTSERPDSESWT